MELTYTNANGESVTLRQTRPFFLTRVDGAGKVRQTVNTFKAPDQDGAFFISSAMALPWALQYGQTANRVSS